MADIYLNHSYTDYDVKLYCIEAIKKSGLNIVGYAEKLFEPNGLTGVWILAESHFTIHTYPEHNYISVDCYTCGDEGNPEAAIDYLLNVLDVSSFNKHLFSRG